MIYSHCKSIDYFLYDCNIGLIRFVRQKEAHLFLVITFSWVDMWVVTHDVARCQFVGKLIQ